jgi:uncharacterized membrane protein YfcA
LFWALLGFIGIFVGAFGTLIGAAGGFILVPILLYLYPQETPAAITSITLTVAFFNALSGSIAYRRLRRIDYRSGLLFSLASVPGAIIGVSITAYLNRGIFETIFGAILLLAAAYLLVAPHLKYRPDFAQQGHTIRKLADAQGNTYHYSFSLLRGMAIAFGAGLISGLLGIGGGIIHVPALTQILAFPTHIATSYKGRSPGVFPGRRCFPPGRSSAPKSGPASRRRSRRPGLSGCWPSGWPLWPSACWWPRSSSSRLCLIP